MKHISELEKTLAHFLDWNKARLFCLVQILQALFLVRTVNLIQISEAFQNSIKAESNYRRIQRFFSQFSFDLSVIVNIVLKTFNMNGKFTLIIDRTNWQWGKNHINIFLLSIDYKGIGIPLFWMGLDSAGMSTTKERIELMQKVLSRFDSKRIKVLLADREFVGEEWFDFLITNNIPFVIRVKKNSMVGGLRNGYEIPIGEVLKELNKRKKKIINRPIVLKGRSLYASFEHAKGAKEPMIVLSNQQFSHPIRLYRQRWGIETLFSCLKTRGFNMEDTHMTDQVKIEKLVFILAIAFCWAYTVGLIRERECPIAVKKHGRKEKSIFRLGLIWIRSVLLQIDKKLKEFKILLLCFIDQPSGAIVL